MRVLAVTQRLHEVEFEEQLLVQPGLRTHVGRDHRIVLGGMGIGLGRELQARGLLGVAAGADFVENLRIVRRVADHRHVGPVLGRRTQHRGTADIDILDGVLHLHVGLRDRLPERIEVHADHVDKLDLVLLQRFQVFGIVAAGQQAAVHVGVQGLDAAVADFGKSRHVADVDNLDTAVGQQFHRAARGDHLPAQGTQALGEINDTRFVADTYQCSHLLLFYFDIFRMKITVIPAFHGRKPQYAVVRIVHALRIILRIALAPDQPPAGSVLQHLHRPAEHQPLERSPVAEIDGCLGVAAVLRRTHRRGVGRKVEDLKPLPYARCEHGLHIGETLGIDRVDKGDGLPVDERFERIECDTHGSSSFFIVST